MLCEVCGQNAATVHVTDIVSAKKRESHLCDHCYKTRENSYKSQEVSVAEALGGLVNVKLDTEEAVTACPHCGMTYEDFRAQGRLGCPHDYEHFKRRLEALLDKIHESVKHAGKRPKFHESRVELRKKLEDLKLELKRAVEVENYEKAAEVRDAIKKLEQPG